jgi:hypothetical protein
MKRLLLIVAAVLGLIVAGGVLVGTPLGSSHPGALRTAMAPAQATALYTPPRSQKARHGPSTQQVSAGR